MTQTANRAPQQGATVTQGACTPGGGAGRGAPGFRADLSEMRPVLHLWGALALRDYQFLADSHVGYDRLHDLAAFMSEAMALRQQLCQWRNGRNKPDTLLAGDVFGPWLGWQPHEPRSGWPDTGRIYAISLPPDVQVPVPRPSGRPRGRKNSVR
jgi:hypothetical protein